MPATIILIEEKLLSQQAILTIYRTRALRGGEKNNNHIHRRLEDQ